MTEQGLTERSRILGCVLGAAVGDALGTPAAWPRVAAPGSSSGDPGPVALRAAPARPWPITAETQLMLFTAEGLIRAHVRGVLRGIVSPPAVVHHALLRWLRTQGETSSHRLFANEADLDGWLIRQSELWVRAAPDPACLDAIRDAPECLSAANGNQASAGLVRVVPVGLLLLSEDIGCFPALAVGLELASLTHGHSTGAVVGGYVAELVALLVEGCELPEAVEMAVRALRGLNGATEVKDAVRRAQACAGSGEPEPTLASAPAGRTGAADALRLALHGALAADDFHSGVSLAASLAGGDHAVAGFAGAVLGAALGADAVPVGLLESTAIRELTLRLGNDLGAIRAGEFDPERAWDDYPGW